MYKKNIIFAILLIITSLFIISCSKIITRLQTEEDTNNLERGEEMSDSSDSNKISISKTATFYISEDEQVGWQEVDSFDLWYNTEAKEKMKIYLKDNNYTIKPGLYEMKQNASFEEAIQVFSFIDMIED